MQVVGADEGLDLEGFAVGSDLNFWLYSEGDANGHPNLILKVDLETGKVLSQVALPEDLKSNARKNGFEGIAVNGEAGAEILYVEIQRAWPDSGDN